MLVTKVYSLPTLAALCGLRDSSAEGAPSCIESVLEWHEVRDGGLWLKAPPGLLFPVEREVLSWHPRQERELPALPIPFTARELAAFMLFGGGWFLYELFADEAKAIGELERLSARNAAEVMRDALALRKEALAKFERDDEKVRNAALWLLDGGQTEVAIVDKRTGPEVVPGVAADDGPLPLTTGDIAFCFDGLRWSEDRKRSANSSFASMAKLRTLPPGQRRGRGGGHGSTADAGLPGAGGGVSRIGQEGLRLGG
jgi:hypothetical protein